MNLAFSTKGFKVLQKIEFVADDVGVAVVLAGAVVLVVVTVIVVLFVVASQEFSWIRTFFS